MGVLKPLVSHLSKLKLNPSNDVDRATIDVDVPRVFNDEERKAFFELCVSSLVSTHAEKLSSETDHSIPGELTPENSSEGTPGEPEEL